MRSSSNLSLGALAAVLLVAIWLRIPGIHYGMPYFYDEDEAHHFNRVAEMVKRGEYNPRYFHKPSLHFYARMPVLAGSFLWSVKEGHIRSIKEIKTRDEAGIAGYAFSVSHPGIVKANRALSVAFWLATIALCYVAARQLFPGSPAAGPIAALLCALSPELIRHAATIGVDGLMSMMCLAATCASLEALRSGKRCSVILASLLAGLAISSKYNALPIVAAPLLASLAARPRDALCLACVPVAAVIGFLAGTPYALAELPMFLDHFAYEIWHYGIAGHEGHTGEPGLQQAIFYSGWLKHDALGTGAIALAAIGIFAMPFTAGDKRAAKLLSFASFPVLFFMLMCSQRANFTRNMLVLVPYVAVAAAGAPSVLAGIVGRRALGRALIGLSVAAAAAQPMARAFSLRSELASPIPESRKALEDYAASLPRGREIAIDAELELPPGFLSRPGVEELSLHGQDAAALHSRGYDEVAAGPAASAILEKDPYASLLRTIEGEPGPSRITRNPRIRIFATKPTADPGAESGAAYEPVESRPGWYECGARGEGFTRDAAEEHCWITRRRAKLALPPEIAERDGATIELSVMSPWPFEQTLEIAAGDFRYRRELASAEAGSWTPLRLTIPGAATLDLSVGGVHSADGIGTGKDTRRLAVALGRLRVID